MLYACVKNGVRYGRLSTQDAHRFGLPTLIENGHAYRYHIPGIGNLRPLVHFGFFQTWLS